MTAPDETFRVSPEPAAAADRPPSERLAVLVRERKFCEAARLYSDLTGENLIDSKLAIDRLARRHGLAPLSGCASHLALMLLLGGAALLAALR